MPWNKKVGNYNFYLKVGVICCPPIYADQLWKCITCLCNLVASHFLNFTIRTEIPSNAILLPDAFLFFLKHCQWKNYISFVEPVSKLNKVTSKPCKTTLLKKKKRQLAEASYPLKNSQLYGPSSPTSPEPHTLIYTWNGIQKKS